MDANFSTEQSNTRNREVIATCPICGKNVYESTKSFYCDGFRDEPSCPTSIFKEFVGTKITKEDVQKVFAGEEIEKELTSKAGNKWPQKLMFNPTTGKLEFCNTQAKLDDTAKLLETNFKCPKCHLNLLRNGVKLECSCGVNFWTRICKKNLSDAQIESILTTGSSNGWIDGFVRKDGREFSAKVQLKEEDGAYSFALDFSR